MFKLIAKLKSKIPTQPMPKMLFFVGTFFFIVFGFYGAKKVLFWWFLSHYQPPAATISATTAEKKDWQSYITAVGTLTAINGVDLSAEVPGIVQDIRVKSGQMVKKGDIILVLRDAIEEANLQNNQAKLQLAQINYDREKTLFNKKVSSQAVLDSAFAEQQQAQASVAATEAQIQQKTIIAPFDGRLGIRQVDLGQYLSPGTPMFTLQSLNPLYVRFTLPEQYLSNLYLGQNIDVAVNIGNGVNVHGSITAINAKVEASSRNVLVEATIPNDKLMFYPGMYGSVNIWLKRSHQWIVLPQTAVSYSLSGDYVFLIKQDHVKDKSVLHVYRQYVKVGERRGDEVAILDGLNPGDRIVTSGQVKLQNGSAVLIDHTVKL